MAFDVTKYARRAAPVQWDDLDLSEFETRPLTPDSLRVLRYMCDIESHTVCYLRDLLVTPSHADPEITTFLTMWNYEEYWHGEVLAHVLAAHGIPTGPEHVASVRRGLGWRDRVAPLKQAVLANLVGEDFIATHMSWGAINEWLTHAGYTALMSREQHPLLDEVLTRVAAQETRHIAFYATQARTRLERSGKARRITRFALERAWQPVGSGVMPEDEVRHLVRHLMGDEARQTARRIDAKIDTLPGLEGMRLVERRVDAILTAA